MGEATPAAMWIDGDQAGLARDVARAAGLSVVAAGGAGSGTLIAETLGAGRALTDLRAALADAGAGLDVRCVVVLARAGLGDADIAALTSAASRRVVVASLEPTPGRLEELTSGSWLGRGAGARAIDTCRSLARLRRGPAMRHARDLLEAFGALRCVWVRCVGAGASGSLGARVVDGLDVLQDLLGAPEAVYAVSTGVGGTGGAEGLGALEGEMCITLSHASGAVGCVQASGRAGNWRREVELVGEGGTLRLEDGSFRWLGPDGAVRDEWRSGQRRGVEAGEVAEDLFSVVDQDPAVEALAESLRRMLDPHVAPEPPGEPEGVLATAHAAVLSARTRSAESAETIRRLLRRE